MLNTTLLDAASKVIKSTTPALFVITAKLFNSTAGSTFTYFSFLIDEIMFDYNYATNFGDVIDMKMRISLKDFANLQDQGSDLRCLLTWTYVKEDGQISLTPRPIQRQYVAIINNPRDIRKATTDVQAYIEPVYEISLRLTEESVYSLRRAKLNTIFQTTTVKQAMYGVAKQLGIKRVHMVDPDNTHVYDHIVIPPYQGISSVYNYLQGAYGVYCKGINYYITNDVLYIYPPFETDPKYDKSVSFYQVDKGRFAGKDAFHSTKGSDTSVVINTEVHSHDLTIAGAENIGTGFIFNRASRGSTDVTTINPDTGATYVEQTALTVSLSGSRSAISKSNNTSYIKSTDNPFPKMSEIVSHMASLAAFEWPNADPFLFDPCHKVVFYYDENQVMVKKTGIIESARYRVSRIKHMDEKYVFGCSAAVHLRLAPNESKVI